MAVGRGHISEAIYIYALQLLCYNYLKLGMSYMSLGSIMQSHQWTDYLSKYPSRSRDNWAYLCGSR